MPPFYKETRLSIRLPNLLKTFRLPLLFCITAGLVSCAELNGAYNYSSENRTPPTPQASPTESAGYVGPDCYNNGRNIIHELDPPSSVGRVVSATPASAACINQLKNNPSERIEFYTDTKDQIGKRNAYPAPKSSGDKTYSSQQNDRSPIIDKGKYR